MSLEQDFVNGIRSGRVDYLRIFLNLHPEMLEKSFSWDGGRGAAIACAAQHNQTEVIRFLVEEKGVDVNFNDVSGWRPLHDAAYAKSYEAAALLLSLGADPAIKRDDGRDTVEFCQSDEVQALIDPSYEEKRRAERIAGTWSCATPKEVKHTYEMPDEGYRLTDVFNFETRHFRSIVESSRGVSHTIRFFDEIPDRTILHQAFQKLKELGGDAAEQSIYNPFTLGKQKGGLRPPP